MAHQFSRLLAVALLIALALGTTIRISADQRGASRGSSVPEPSPLADGEYTIKPPFSNSPDLIFNNSVPHGTVHRFTMKSEDSKIYKGISRAQPGAVVPYERPVAVYIPAQYVPGTAAPFIGSRSASSITARRGMRRRSGTGSLPISTWLRC